MVDVVQDEQLNKVQKHVEDFINVTEPARFLSERDRDYKDHKQWTREERETLRRRGQAAIVDNRVKPKVEGLKGLIVRRKTDPKAFPRTQKHEEGAEAVTDGLRFVADNNDFDNIKLDVADNIFVEGYGAAIVEIAKRGEEREIVIRQIPWDRYYYDPHSRKLDFSDKRYDGIAVWMDVEVVTETFDLDDVVPDDLLNPTPGDTDTFEDRPKWIDTLRKRVRVCQHFWIEKGVWHMAFFTHGMFLMEPKPSPFLDEDGNPTNPIEAQAAYMDRDNNRYGEVRYWVDMQDEVNHRRSKGLHFGNKRQTAARNGAVKDIAKMKKELAKPDGHVEWEGEKGDFEVLDTGEMTNTQFALLEQAMQSLDASSFNAQLSGERQGDLSGKAVIALQQAGVVELASLFAGVGSWEKRIYRQVWYRIKQFWDAEKWVRIMDDERKLRWVGFNVPITLQQQLEETINDKSLSELERRQAAETFLPMMEAQDPRLQTLVETRNDIAELDVDILIEQSFDTVTIQQEQFEILAQLAANRPEVPFTQLLRLSQLRDKDKLIEEIDKQVQQGHAIQQQERQVEMAQGQADVQKTQMESAETEQRAIQHKIENVLLVTDPERVTSVAV